MSLVVYCVLSDLVIEKSCNKGSSKRNLSSIL